MPGLEVVERRTHSIESLSPDPGVLRGRFDLAIFTSRAAVERFFARADLVERLPDRVLAVGPATAANLSARISSGVEDGGGSASRVLERLPPRMASARVLLPRGEDASDELPRELAARGAEVALLALYRKIALPYDAALDDEIRSTTLAAFCATSPSAARWLFGGASADVRERLRRTPAIALGDPTRHALEERGVEHVAIAEPPTFESAARLASALAGRGRRA